MDDPMKNLKKDMVAAVFQKYSLMITDELTRMCLSSGEPGEMGVMTLLHTISDLCFLYKIEPKTVGQELVTVYDKLYAGKTIEGVRAEIEQKLGKKGLDVWEQLQGKGEGKADVGFDVDFSLPSLGKSSKGVSN